MTDVRVTIPGTPVAQGRGRAVRVGQGVRVVDPKKSRSWKATAQAHMLDALWSRVLPAFPDGPLQIEVLAVWPCPRSRHLKSRKREAVWRDKRPDLDNVIKAVKDAASGVLWGDDAQVVSLHAWALDGEQGAAPGVSLRVSRVTSEDLLALPRESDHL